MPGFARMTFRSCRNTWRSLDNNQNALRLSEFQKILLASGPGELRRAPSCAPVERGSLRCIHLQVVRVGGPPTPPNSQRFPDRSNPGPAPST
jgi:hypothetical protein